MELKKFFIFWIIVFGLVYVSWGLYYVCLFDQEQLIDNRGNCFKRYDDKIIKKEDCFRK